MNVGPAEQAACERLLEGFERLATNNATIHFLTHNEHNASAAAAKQPNGSAATGK
jgi:hypothetical protein